MLLIEGKSQKSVSKNISEMMKAGHSQKQAIAASLAMKRKVQQQHKAHGGPIEECPHCMAEGGLVAEEAREPVADEGSVNAGDEGPSGEAVFPKESGDEEGLSESVQAEEMLAKGLQARKDRANNNDVKFAAEPGHEEGRDIAESGLEVHSGHVDSVGDKPELDWINDGTEAPMSTEPSKSADLDHSVEDSVPMGGGLSEDAKKAIEEHKKKRRFGSFGG